MTTFKEDLVLKLNIVSLYGLCNSPQNFFEHLKSKVLKVGFTQSKHNPCLFISKKVIFLVYVNNCLFYSPNQSDINNIITKIKGEGLGLSIADDVAGFLGVLLHKNEMGSITLTQIGLIDQIISALGLEQANNMSTLAPRSPLGRDLLGAPFLNHYN